MRKGQSKIVSAILVVLIGLGIVGTVFPWASSIIEKKKDAKSVDDAFNFFEDLERTIVDIARNSGKESMELKVPGKLTIYSSDHPSDLNNSLVFMFESKVSNVANGTEWIPLNTPNANSTGTLGIDKPGVILGKSQMGGERIVIWYRLWFRELEDKTTGNIYKIDLSTSGASTSASSTSGFLRIHNVGSEGTSLIKTKINIIV